MKKHKSIGLCKQTWAKVAAYMICVLMSAVTAASVFTIITLAHYADIYTTDKEYYLRDALSCAVFTDAESLITNKVLSNSSSADYLDGNVVSYSIRDMKTGKTESKALLDNTDEVESFTSYIALNSKKNSVADMRSDMPGNADISRYKWYEINLEYLKVPSVGGRYRDIYSAVGLGYALRYSVFIILGISFIIGLSAFIFLMCASGHRKTDDELYRGWGTAVPLDLLTAAMLFPLFFLAKIVFTNQMELFYTLAIGVIFYVIPLIGYCMSLALRIKLGKWWKNTLIYYFLRALYRFAKWIVTLAGKLPLIPKTLIGGSVILLLEIILLVVTFNIGMNPFIIIFKLLLFAAAIAFALELKNLKDSGRAIADCDMNAKIDITKLHFPDTKAHGEALNSISVGINRAVNEQLKSERMKTELITNVSHDIKTPLTSIINYSDLIAKEKTGNEKITEYSKVLTRQSERLKRLIEDLVEASKASTGNLEVILAPCDVSILLSQASAEYEERLKAARLELIADEKNDGLIIEADGRRLWRVFDNLLNNICKYAQPGTRVYITLEKEGDDALITFKNTSRAPLNISAEELMERFVRGDESRNTEGNGLGLSIAKSLTELQNGTLSIEIDGDLFKASLRFGLIES